MVSSSAAAAIRNRTAVTLESLKASFDRRTVLFVLLIALVSHVGLGALNRIAAPELNAFRSPASRSDPVLAITDEQREQVSSLDAVNEWFSWDAVHYEALSSELPLFLSPPLEPQVSATGPAWSEMSWPPLYPTLIGLLGALWPADRGLMMIAIGWLLQIGFLLIVARWMKDRFPAAEAHRFLVLTVAASPLCFLIGTPMSEPLFAVLAAFMLWRLERKQWVIVGLAAATLIWVRHGAILLVVPLLYAAVQEIRHQRSTDRRRRLLPLVAPVLCATSYGLFVVWTRWLTGVWDAPAQTQRNGWGNTPANPLANLVRGLDKWQYQVVLAVVILAVALWVRRYLSSPELLYCLVIAALALTNERIFAAAPRILALAFPVWIALGRALLQRSEVVRVGVIASLASAQAVLFVLWANFWLGAIV